VLEKCFFLQEALSAFTDLLELKLFSVKDFKNEVLDTCHLMFPN